MKYALITDNSVQWFSYVVSIFDTGEVAEYHNLPNDLNNEFISNINRPTFGINPLVIPGESNNSWTGMWLSKYEFDRIKKMITLYPSFKEYIRLGELQKIW